METNQQQLDQKQQDAAQNLASLEGEAQEQEEVQITPGVSVIKSSTPRPLSFERVIARSVQGQGETFSQPGFPAKAPSAPPLPEEPEEGEGELSTETVAVSATMPPTSQIGQVSQPEPVIKEIQEAQDFDWLFEYGLAMDPAILNSAERLNGLALLYGPAVLKGYTVVCANVHLVASREARESDTQTVATIMPDPGPDAEVWGVLYRIPHRLTIQAGNEQHSMLDTVHAAAPPQSLFRSATVVVRESYRGRELSCITYILAESVIRRVSLFTPQYGATLPFVQRLSRVAREQKLPESYLNVTEPRILTTPLPIKGYSTATQDTDPLPVLREKNLSAQNQPSLPEAAGSAKSKETPAVTQLPSRPRRALTVFATYLVLMLVAVLACAILQSLGLTGTILIDRVAPLGVPGPVIVYGLLGGCVSSLLSLGRCRAMQPPMFVVITWFARPFVGAVLSLLVYLLLISGAFALGENAAHHMPIFLLAGAIAGLCEGWIFLSNR
ncbi:MAG: gamma-glutamylcyclotransferase [Ktedonobacteraceae bacterium]|nr:gamma-glutamylcyclotransferase [Ktedonobacteraceae bacterium]